MVRSVPKELDKDQSALLLLAQVYIITVGIETNILLFIDMHGDTY